MIPVLYTTFNRLNYTKQTLPILLENTKNIIVIDNGSTDGTVDYLKSLSGVELVLKKENTGISGAMNTFFDMTKDAKYVAKVDNDTVVPKNWLKDLLPALNKVEIVQAKHYFFSTIYENWENLRNRRPAIKINGGNLVYAKIVGGTGVVFKRNIIAEHLAQRDLYGWGDFQRKNKQHRRGFFDGVWIDLLDMAGYNQYKDDIDMKYFLSTKRFLKRETNA